jgi:hypothetical protein
MEDIKLLKFVGEISFNSDNEVVNFLKILEKYSPKSKIVPRGIAGGCSLFSVYALQNNEFIIVQAIVEAYRLNR